MTATASERLSELNTKERALSGNLIRINTEFESLEKELAKLSAEAIERFGTDDLEVLREKFRAADRQNTEALNAYEEGLKAVEAQLSALKSAEV